MLTETRFPVRIIRCYAQKNGFTDRKFFNFCTKIPAFCPMLAYIIPIAHTMLRETKTLPPCFCRHAHKNGRIATKNREPAPMHTETGPSRKVFSFTLGHVIEFNITGCKMILNATLLLCSEKRIRHTNLQTPKNNAIDNAIKILKPLKTRRFLCIEIGFDSRTLLQKRKP